MLAASGLGRHLIKRLSSAYSDIHLGDMYPFRQSVYELQRDIGSSPAIHKHPLMYKANLVEALNASDDLLFITHDYFKLAHSKNFYLQKLSKAAKNKSNVVVVLPVEYDLEDNKEIVDDLKESLPDALILRTNYMFGEYNSYLIQHMLQYISTPSMLVSTGGNTMLHPIDSEALI